jgi:membrane-associated phospholipid phosphatase
VRPISETSLIKALGWSFPSGHAVMSVVFYGIITYFIVRSVKSWNLRVFTVMAAGFIVFIVGFSRIYLQVHYLSDVLGGYASGFFWLAMCITGLEAYIRKTKSHLCSCCCHNLPCRSWLRLRWPPLKNQGPQPEPITSILFSSHLPLLPFLRLLLPDETLRAGR